MPRAYSNDLRERVIRAVGNGQSCRQAGRAFHVSASTAVKWVQRWRRTGAVGAKQIGGYKRSKLAPHTAFLLELAKDQPDLSIEEIRARLAVDRVVVGYGTVWRFFKAQRYSVKKNRSRGRAGSRRRRSGARAVAGEATDA